MASSKSVVWGQVDAPLVTRSLVSTLTMSIVHKFKHFYFGKSNWEDTWEKSWKTKDNSSFSSSNVHHSTETPKPTCSPDWPSTGAPVDFWEFLLCCYHCQHCSIRNSLPLTGKKVQYEAFMLRLNLSNSNSSAMVRHSISKTKGGKLYTKIKWYYQNLDHTKYFDCLSFLNYLMLHSVNAFNQSYLLHDTAVRQFKLKSANTIECQR